MPMPVNRLHSWTCRHLPSSARLTNMQFGGIIHAMRMTLMAVTSTMILMPTGLSTGPDLRSKHFNYLVIHVGSPWNALFVGFLVPSVNPPFDYVFRGPDGTFTSYGSAHNVIIWLAAKLNYTFSFVLLNQTLVDQYGTHEAAFYQVINDKDIDGIATNFYLTMNRVQRMDYTTHPAWVDGFRLVVPRLGEESRLFAFIGPFEPMVWLLIFISILVVVAVMTLFAMVYRCYPWNASHLAEIKTDTEIGTVTARRKPISRNILFNFFGSHTIYVAKIMTNQGAHEAFGCYSFRLLVGIWVLCATVLVNSYTGIVISSLTTRKTKPSIDSFENLAASSETKILLRHDTSIGEQILQATSGVYKVLGDQARNNPENIVGDAFKVTEKLETGHYAFPFVGTFAIAFVASHYKKDQQCRFKASKQLPLSTGYYSMLFKKKSSYTDAHSRALLDLRETGITNFWVYKLFLPTIPRADQCFIESTRRVTRIVPIQLSDLTSAFLILGIGTGLAVLTFLLEVLYSKCQRYRLSLV